MIVEKKLQQNLTQNSGAMSLLVSSMSYMDSLFDPGEQLLQVPGQPHRHNVRESIWYAFGLILQVRFGSENPEKLEQATAITARVLQEQLLEEGEIWHGTFRRTPDEPRPQHIAKIWEDYDPNWRQFIGTVLVLMLRLEENGSLKSIRKEIELSLHEIQKGEPFDRVPPSYTNIALMKAWLDLNLATDEESRQQALRYATSIVEGFNKHGAFREYNSPTYYGINLYALSLWTDFSDDLADKGRHLTELLWRDIGRYYHSGLRNLCGPWSRSYGMDMHQYAAALGLWIWSQLGQAEAPFPKGEDFTHAHDFCLGPLAAACCTPLTDATTSFITEQTYPRSISQIISSTPGRTATALLDKHLMVGVETSEVSFHGTEQYHPLTAHWREHNSIQWMRLRFSGRLAGGDTTTTTESARNFVRLDLQLHPDPGTEACQLEFSTDVTEDLGNEQYRVGGLKINISVNSTISIRGTVIHISIPEGTVAAMSVLLAL